MLYAYPSWWSDQKFTAHYMFSTNGWDICCFSFGKHLSMSVASRRGIKELNITSIYLLHVNSFLRHQILLLWSKYPTIISLGQYWWVTQLLLLYVYNLIGTPESLQTKKKKYYEFQQSLRYNISHKNVRILLHIFTSMIINRTVCLWNIWRGYWRCLVLLTQQGSTLSWLHPLPHGVP